VAALAANAQATATFEALDAKNHFAIYYRQTSVKNAETQSRKVAEFVAMLARGRVWFEGPQAASMRSW
jgi:uncharacterized protein YdeI (YjbR/CyaY-like superfamily)